MDRRPIFLPEKRSDMKYVFKFHHLDEEGPDIEGLQRTVKNLAWAGAILAVFSIAMCSATIAHGQTDFYSPFSVVVTPQAAGSKSVTDIYHTSVHVTIESDHIVIGTDSEGGKRFVHQIQGTEVESARKTRYIIPDGIVTHETDAHGETVTWTTSKFMWRLFSFMPTFIEIEN